MLELEARVPAQVLEVQGAQAPDKELKSIKDNDFLTLVPRPEDQKVVDSRWVLRIKDDGLYKARFSAKGFAQQWGVDYVDTFAPVHLMHFQAESCSNRSTPRSESYSRLLQDSA